MSDLSLELARHHVREDKSRLEAQLAAVARLKAAGRPTEVAEMLARAYQKFVEQSSEDLAEAERSARESP